MHIVDEKGRPVGEGVVEFARKGGALETLKRVGEGVFLLTGDPRPVTVEALEPRDEEDGLSERMCQVSPDCEDHKTTVVDCLRMTSLDFE